MSGSLLIDELIDCIGSDVNVDVDETFNREVWLIYVFITVW